MDLWSVAALIYGGRILALRGTQGPEGPKVRTHVSLIEKKHLYSGQALATDQACDHLQAGMRACGYRWATLRLQYMYPYRDSIIERADRECLSSHNAAVKILKPPRLQD